MSTSKVCTCDRQQPVFIPGDGPRELACFNCGGKVPQKGEPPPAESAILPPRPPKAEMDIIERKLLAAKALIDDGLSRLKELKAT